MSLEGFAYRVGVADADRQVLVTPRFNLTWSPSSVEASGETTLAEFRLAFSSMVSYLRAEKAGDQTDQHGALLAFATMMSIDGSSVTYHSRNTRYTNVAGTFMAEAIEPSLPVDVVGTPGSIPNPLNWPELQEPSS